MLLINSQKTLQFTTFSKNGRWEGKIIIITIECVVLKKFEFLDNIQTMQSRQMEVTKYKLDEKTVIIENKACKQNKKAGGLNKIQLQCLKLSTLIFIFQLLFSVSQHNILDPK